MFKRVLKVEWQCPKCGYTFTTGGSSPEPKYCPGCKTVRA